MSAADEVTLLPLKDVKARVGISGATIYRKMAAGEFPKPRKVGARSLWVSTEIDAWIAAIVGNESMGQSMGQDIAA